jgi:hypothetical protein
MISYYQLEMVGKAQVPDSRCLGAIFAEVACHFRGIEAERAGGIMGTSPDSEHVGGEKFPMEGKPGE